MADFVTVARVGQIADQRGAAFLVAGRRIAVFFADGQYYASDEACPHEGVSLAYGWCRLGAIVCPRHTWRFRVTDGGLTRAPQSPYRLRIYPTRVVRDEIQVRIE